MLYYGVRLNEFRAPPHAVEQLREQLGLVGRRVIATFGRLTGAKGQAHILAAMQLVRRDIPEAVLLAVGTPPTAQTKDPQLVVETERLDGQRLAAAYGVAELVVVPSVYLDMFPTVGLEAMAAGKPVVVSCFAGTSEIIENGQTGFVVNPLNVEALAERICWLLNHRDEATRIGAAGQKLIEEQFTLEQCAARYLEILEGLARSRRT